MITVFMIPTPTNQLSVVMETINERIHSEIANMERENSIHSPIGLRFDGQN